MTPGPITLPRASVTQPKPKAQPTQFKGVFQPYSDFTFAGRTHKPAAKGNHKLYWSV